MQYFVQYLVQYLVQYSEWIIPAPLLIAVAWVRFNQPPTNRSGTTFALFSVGLIIYCVLITVLWLLVIVAFNQGSVGIDKLSLLLRNGSPQAQAEFIQHAPILAALVIVAATHVAWIREIDEAAREFCITLAAIPREADRLTLELAQTAHFRPRSERLRDKISKIIKEEIHPQALSFEAGESPDIRFTRAVGLYWLFVGHNGNGTVNESPPANRAAFIRIMQLSEAALARLAQRYNEMMEDALNYFTAPHPNKKLEEALNRSISEVTLLTCNLIARYVLSSNATENKRRQRLFTMGFDTTGAIWTFGADQWVITTLAVIVLSCVMIACMPGTLPLSSGHILTISLTFSLSIGFAVIGAVWVAQRFLERYSAETTAGPPIADLTLAAMIVAVLSAGLRIAIPLVPALIQGSGSALPDAIDQFLARWPGIIIPVTCTISLGLLCTYVGARTWKQYQVAAAGALGNGLAFAIASLLVSSLLSDAVLAQFYRPEAYARVLALVTTALIGAVIGAMVLWQFKRSERMRQDEAARAIESARAGMPGLDALKPPPGLDSTAPSQPNVAPQSYGGYSYDMVKDLVGQSYICIRPAFTAPGAISAYLIDLHWDKEASCLTFDEKDREDSAYTQRGRVYIPNGRPFMSFVTVEGGAIRLVMVSRPSKGESARGLIMTLSISGAHSTPASAPIVLRPVTNKKIPKLGFIRSGAPDFESYGQELATVAPEYGFFAAAPRMATSADVEKARLALVE